MTPFSGNGSARISIITGVIILMVDIFMKYTFLSFLMLWRHRSRDQDGSKFNIRSKSLLEPFSKNIFKRSCSLINSVLKNGHDYLFLKKCGSRKSNWKVCQLPGQRPFEVGIKENFAKGLRVCSVWWRCQFLLFSIAFGEDRCLRFFQRRGPGGKSENEALLSRTFCSLRRRATKFQGLDNGLDLHFL